MKQSLTLMPRLLMAIAFCANAIAQDPGEQLSPEAKRQLKRVVATAFASSHDGYSSDEVILQDELNARFIKACQDALPDYDAGVFNWTLLNLRKAGELKTNTTKINRQDLQAVLPIAEMAARFTEDKLGLSTDRIMVDPAARTEFDATVQKISEGTDPYLARKAAFRLRKARQLKPELITRIADWGRVVSQHSAASLANDPDQIPHRPGVYLFRDASGYLYIGEAADLHERLSQHLDQSDRQSLAAYLAEREQAEIIVEIHAFDPDSRAREVRVRRAYESELIQSREPKFNIRP